MGLNLLRELINELTQSCCSNEFRVSRYSRFSCMPLQARNKAFL